MQKQKPKLINQDPSNPLHIKWKSMIHRCYFESQLKSRNSYRDVTVCEDWFDFNHFTNWYNNQPLGEHLDKDLKLLGSKMYSPETCLLVSAEVNNFMVGFFLPRGQYPKGVAICNTRTSKRNLKAQLNRGSGSEHLGWFDCVFEAHACWQLNKANRAFELANNQSNTQVSEALYRVGEKLLDDRLLYEETIFN